MCVFLVVTLAVILIAVIIIGLNPLWLMNAMAFSKTVKRIKDLPYANDSRHNLDIYIPDHTDVSKPVIVFVYGGAWDSGHKDDYQFAGMEFAKLGYVTAIPNYRLYPDAKFPNFIEDVASACAALPKHLSDLEINGDKGVSSLPLDVIFIGHSAGAHTVAMLNTQPCYLENAEANINIKACIGMAGPYDLPLDDPLVVGKFDGIQVHDISDQYVDMGYKHNSHDANPINLARVGIAKMLLMHGRADDTVGLYHLERFAKRLKELDIEHETIIYDKVPHHHIVGGIAGVFHFLNPVFKDISDYLAREG
jgi:acetyl esterase/lipase